MEPIDDLREETSEIGGFALGRSFAWFLLVVESQGRDLAGESGGGIGLREWGTTCQLLTRDGGAVEFGRMAGDQGRRDLLVVIIAMIDGLNVFGLVENGDT